MPDNSSISNAELMQLRADVTSAQASLNKVPPLPRHAGSPGGLGGGQWWSTHDAMTISVVVLAFGAVVIAIAAITSRKNATVESSLRLYGTIMVITLATFLVVAGYDDHQIAAPLGLFGTIAGYLLGRSTSEVKAGAAPEHATSHPDSMSSD